MRRVRLPILLTALAALLVVPAVAQVGTRMEVSPSAFMIEPQISDFDGSLSDVTDNPDNICWDGIPKDAYQGGDSVSWNVMWKDLSNGGMMYFDVVWAVRKPNGSLFVLNQWSCGYDTSSVPPGTNINFCCYFITQEIPGINYSNVWGARVAAASGTLQGPLGTITITP